MTNPSLEPATTTPEPLIMIETGDCTPVEMIRRSVHRVMNNEEIRDIIDLSKQTAEIDSERIARNVGDQIAEVIEPWLITNWEIGAMDSFDVIRALHVAQAEMYIRLGLSNVAEGGGERKDAGLVRTENVMFGEKVPADHDDTDEILTQFCDTLDALIREDPQMLSEDKADTIIAWAHSCLISIHPFIDGNGRSARSMANLVGKMLYSKLGKDYQRKDFASSKDEIPHELDQAFYEAGLLPAEDVSKIDAEKKTLWQKVLTKLGIVKSTKSSWTAFVVHGQERYFQLYKEQIMDHLRKITSSEDLMLNQGLQTLKRYMKETSTVTPTRETAPMEKYITAEELATLY